MSEIIIFSGYISSFRNNFRGDLRNFSPYVPFTRDEGTLNSEEMKPVNKAIIELCLSEDFNRSVNQSVSQQKNLLNTRKF